jgi:hypothetical protein
MKAWALSHKKSILILLTVLVVITWGALVAWWWIDKQNRKTDTHTNTSSVQTAQTQTTQSATDLPLKTVDMTKLPVGDDRVSTTAQSGYVMRCGSGNGGEGGGAQVNGPWIHGDTWDRTAKVSVDGSVNWPTANVSITLAGDVRKISGNGLPVGSATGTFPIKSGTAAYTYDRNPNRIQAQTVQINITANPAAAAKPNCLGGGPIGYMTNGVALFDGLDAEKRDAPAHEIQDKCDGHPQISGMYHYHDLSDCVPGAEENNKLIGYALDGYGIFSSKDARGSEYTNADLDACHGLTSQITWDGKTVTMYHYVMTREFPYSLGCFHGTPVTTR